MWFLTSRSLSRRWILTVALNLAAAALREGGCVPLTSVITLTELTRMFGYPKFNFSSSDRSELLSDYLPFCEVIERTRKSTLCATSQTISASWAWR